ncbi:MAG TPA: hypothetical protein DET40_12445 [Lentisphaeria bacterium]|nr:MAG: hypothetical protein A2X45_00430 [Lentisphaerae bacterium GWF2_50_93]HCE44348.1 hypothetical protein [Lentisphaeria bacterium]
MGIKSIKAVSARPICLAAACMVLLNPGAGADSVTGEENAKGTVQSVTAAEIKMKEGKTLPLAKVRKVEFDGFAVAAKDAGVFLKDGTKLTGVFRDSPDGQIFRSTTLGPLKLKNEDVSAFFYDSEFLGKLASDKNLAAPLVIDKKGVVYAGKIMWSDTKSAGVKTSEGLKKIPIEELSIIYYSAFKPSPSVILRNGDIINLTREFKGESMSVTFGDKKIDVPIKAIKEINL